MQITDQGTGVDRRALLSTLWIFVLLNVLIRDVHEVLSPGFVEELMTGSLNGTPLSDTVLLFGGLLAEIQIAMVVLSRVLPHRANRLANIVAGLVGITMGAVLMVTATPDPDDVFFAVIEIIALAAIVHLAWVWPAAKRSELLGEHRNASDESRPTAES